jgi:hypothetical protein
VVEDVRGFIGDHKVFDDITVVVLKQRWRNLLICLIEERSPLKLIL